MMPIYRYMDSFPHQRSQSGYHHQPQQQFPTYPINPSMAYEPYWPNTHSGNYGHSMPYGSCCSHSHSHNQNFHSFGPFFSQPTPPRPVYHFPEAYPYHSAEMPRFEYDYRVPWNQEHNCCGCPSHQHHHGMEEKGAKIEEPRAKGSFVPVRMKGCPYTVVWVPEEECLKDKIKPFEAEKEEKQNNFQKRFPLDEKVSERKDLPFPFIWAPSDDENREGGNKANKDSNSAVDKRSEDQNRQFPFPIIWMPSQDTTQKEVEDKDGKDKQLEKLPYIFNFLPMKQKNTSPDHEANGKERSKAEKTDSAKQISPSKEEEKPKLKETNNEASKPTETEEKKQTTKLPPVCLRVDPLPRKKKNGNGSSRSPSPPREKRDSQRNSDENENVPKKMDPKVIVVTEKASDHPNVHVERTKAVELSKKLPNEQSTVLVDYGEERKHEKKKLSDGEAALRIQSAYRGFEIRRSQPLKKLKQISEVREQVVEVRDRIRALESGSDAQKDNKQKLIIGETIMRLLLRLDTIQGLHPSLREIRKSLAKELVSLQEKLDSLVTGEPEEPKSEAVSAKPVEESLAIEADKIDSKREQPEVQESNNSPDDSPKTTHDSTEVALKCEETPLSGADNELQVDGDSKLEEPNSEVTVENKDEEVINVGTGICASELMKEVTELEKSSEVSAEEEVPKESDSTEDSSEPVGATHGNDSAEIDLGEKSTQVAGDDELMKPNNDIEQAVSENSEVTVVEADEHELTELPMCVVDELQGTNETAPMEDKTSIEAEKPEVTMDKNQGFEKIKKDETKESLVPISIVANESQDSSDESAEVVKEVQLSDEVSVEPKLGNNGTKIGRDQEVAKENEKLKEMMEKLLEAGKEQLEIITSLSGRVMELEKKLSRRTKKKKLRANKPSKLNLKDRAVGFAL